MLLNRMTEKDTVTLKQLPFQKITGVFIKYKQNL